MRRRGPRFTPRRKAAQLGTGLLYGQGALHTGGRVSVDAAEEGVLARLQVLGQRGVALTDRLAAADLLAARAADADGVRNRGRIREVDRHRPRLAAQLLGVVGDRIGVRGEIQRRGSALRGGRGRSGGRCRGGFAAGRLVLGRPGGLLLPLLGLARVLLIGRLEDG